MEDLTIVAGTADAAALYESYVDLSRRFDEANAQIDALAIEAAGLNEDQTDERVRMLGELDQLDIGRTVLLGWVSAFYAAYVFALRGTETPWLDRTARTSTRFIGAGANVVHPLTRAHVRGRR